MQDKIPDISTNLELCAKLQKKKNTLRKELSDMGLLKNGEVNTYDSYQYFSEAQYKELFTKLFSKHGIELFIDEADYGTFEGTDKQPFGRTVTLACTLIDIDTGFAETSRHTGEGLDRGDKAGYKATTGALKRFLSSTFLVATQDDPEREDDKGNKKTSTTTINRKTNTSSKVKKGTITKGQKDIIITTFKDNVNELKKILKDTYKVCKIDELSIEQASQLIKKSKGDNK